jgi:hypothetical protein
MGKLSRHKKTKMGALPGDIPLQSKVEMLEKGKAAIRFSKGYSQEMGKKASKAFKKILRGPERARLKERCRTEFEE